jgi:hypothetical protein
MKVTELRIYKIIERNKKIKYLVDFLGDNFLELNEYEGYVVYNCMMTSAPIEEQLGNRFYWGATLIRRIAYPNTPKKVKQAIRESFKDHQDRHNF